MGRDREPEVGIPRQIPVDTELHKVPSISYEHLFGGENAGRYSGMDWVQKG